PRHVRATRTAISPRFAIRILRIATAPEPPERRKTYRASPVSASPAGWRRHPPKGARRARRKGRGRPDNRHRSAARVRATGEQNFARCRAACERRHHDCRGLRHDEIGGATMKKSLFALALCAACNPSPQAPSASKTSVIVIGQLVDRTGSIATPSWGESIRLAVVHANQALKLSGKAVRFEIAEANSGNSPDMARAGALQLVKQQNAKAIITDSSQDDIAVNMLNYDGDASHQLDVPIVCMACTSPAIDNPQAQDADSVKQAALRNGKGWNFRTTLSDAYQARMVVRMLVSSNKGDANGDGKFKLSIYASDDPYGHGFSEAIKADAIKAHPGAIIEQVYHDVKANPAEYDWASDVARVTDKRSNGKADVLPDAVVEIT